MEVDIRYEDVKDVKEYVELFSAIFRDNVQHQLDAFVESISLYCAPRVKTNDDQSSSPSQTDANELIRLQAELDEAHAVISVLRGALQLSYAINAKKYPKAR